jgi:hypothetical protein
MQDKHAPANIEPLDESELKDELDNEIFAKDKKRVETLNKKVHEGGEPESLFEEPPEPEITSD